MRHQFIRPFGRCVQRHRVTRRFVDRVRQFRTGSIDRTRRRIDEVRDCIVAAARQYVHHADDVTLNVAIRILQRIANAGLRTQVHDPLEFFSGEQRRHLIAVCQIQMDEPKRWARLQPREPRLFERNVVIVIEIVEPDDLIGAIEQALRGCRSDETGRAGDENFH